MSRSDEDALRYPLGHELPAPWAALDVAPGVRWLRMALPFALDHINLGLLPDHVGLAHWLTGRFGILATRSTSG